MEMWLKRLILVFLTGAAMTATFEDLVTLDDKNKSVKLSFGSPLNLKCNLNTSEMIRFRVSWDFIPGSSATKINVRNISSKLVNRFGKTTAMAKDNHSDHEENMLHHISSAANNNSGFYYCTVREEIPGTNTITSKKTEVVIMKSVELTTHLTLVTSQQATVSLDWWKWILLGVSAFTLIILLLVSILLRRRCRGRRGTCCPSLCVDFTLDINMTLRIQSADWLQNERALLVKCVKCCVKVRHFSAFPAQSHRVSPEYPSESKSSVKSHMTMRRLSGRSSR